MAGELNGARILIIDDDMGNLNLLGNILKTKGARISVADSGLKGIETAKLFLPDIILLDIMMPGTDGYQVAEKIKYIKELQETRIIFLTAKRETGDVVKALNTGGVDYITKPFVLEELIARTKIHYNLKNAKDGLKAANEQTNKLISILSHDLKNPLTGILLTTDFLIDESQNLSRDEIIDSLKSIKRSANNQYITLRNTLKWANVRNERIVFSPAKRKLKITMEKAIETIKPAADRKKIILSNELNEILEFEYDEDLIYSVLVNLVNNAVKFSESGSYVMLNAKDVLTDIIIEVKDAGTGMTEEEAAMLFKSDARPRSKKGTDGEKGTGLGLLICKEYIDLHNGKIEVQSKLGEGATFTIKLPKMQNDRTSV